MLINELKTTLGVSNKDVEQEMTKKTAEKGAFEKRAYISDVTVSSSSPFYNYYIKNPSKFPVIDKYL